MSRLPLMPKATAVWLVDNTSLTFDQIANFCQLHELEVKGIADGDVAQGIKGMDPLSSGQLTRDELEKAQSNPAYQLKLAESKVDIPEVKTKRGPRYTPVSRRQDRPDAISWLIRNHPELTDSQVIKLVGTTKPTIHAIRERTHWNSPNIKPVDPVTLGLCKQTELDAAVQKAAARLDRERKLAEAEARKSGTLLPVSETVAPAAEPEVEVEATAAEIEEQLDRGKPANVESVFGKSEPAPPEPSDEDGDFDPDSVFAKLKELKPESEE